MQGQLPLGEESVDLPMTGQTEHRFPGPHFLFREPAADDAAFVLAARDEMMLGRDDLPLACLADAHGGKLNPSSWISQLME
jgi:hypothetical protein